MKEDLQFAVYERRDDGLIVLRLKDEVSIDLQKAQLMNEALTKVTAGVPRKILVLNGRFTTADNEARALLSSHQKKLQIRKAAVTIHSLSQ